MTCPWGVSNEGGHRQYEGVSGHETCREMGTKGAEALGVTRGSVVWAMKREVPPVRLGRLSEL
jgi:hypothetical protein